MAEHHDYQALEWVKGEIDETLKQAQQSLEAFVDNPDDSTRMRFCLTHLHQVYGTLQMVEFYGAALVAEEMEKLAQALLNQTVPHVADAQEVLMRAILQLPVYLDSIKSARRDMPVVVLPLLNDLRAARGESLLSETALFKPDLAAGSAAAPKEKVSPEALAQLPELLKKIRQLYQFALVGLIRHQDMPTNLGYMAKSLTKLEQLYSNTPMAQLWWVSAALVDGVSRNEIELGTSVKMLFGQLDRQLKHSIDTGADRNEPVPMDLLKNLLFYVARCKGDAPRIRKVKEAFKLDSALPSEEMLDVERRRLTGPDRSAISSVVRALLDELGTVKDTLDLFMRGQNSATADLKPVIPTLKQVADTLAVLGIGNPRRVIMEQIDVVGRITATNAMPADTVLMDVAGALLYVEATLQGMADDAGRNSGAAAASSEPGHVSPEHVVKARAAVIEESRAGLENAKDAISEYHATGFNPAALDLVPDILHSVRGGLLMIPLAYPGALLQSCIDFIREQLIDKRVKPTWRELDTLADAITSIEYYLERLGDRFPGDEDILAIAEEAVAALGYPAARVSSEEMAPTLSTPVPAPVTEQPAPVMAEPAAAEVEEEADETAIEAELTLVPGEDEEFITFSAEELAELEAEPTPAPTAPVVPAASAEPLEEEDNELIDDEVIEIFIEEAGEVLETINENLPQWAADTENEGALKELRRAYHTLKGSGRMVGAKIIGELAWSVENMLNRVLDHSVPASGAVIRIVETVTGVVPSLVKSFENRTRHTINVDALAAVADALAKGQTPPAIPADLSLAAAAPAPVAPTAAAIAEEAPEAIALAAAEPAQEAAETEAAAEEWGFALEDESGAHAQETAVAEAAPAFEQPAIEETEFELADEFASLEDREHVEAAAEVAEESGLEFDLLEPEAELPILEAETAADWSDLGFVEEQVDDAAAQVPEVAADDFLLAASSDELPLVEPPLVEEISLAEEIPAAVEAAPAPTAIEIDPVLVDIFSQEAAAHLQTIKEFLAAASEREPLTETLLRALHTLKGSAHMAGIKPIAELATPIERFIKECHLQGVPADERIKLLLDDVVRLIEQGLVDLKSHPSQPLHGSEIVLECIEQMREEKLKHAREAQAAKLGRPDPALVSLFLAEGMDLIVDAGDVLRHWEENPIPGAQLDNLRQELRILARGASAAQLSEVVVLCMTLEELYNAAASGMITPDSTFFRTAHKAHEELVNMMDYIAAGQPIAPADAIVSELQALMDQAPQVSEQIEHAAQLHVEQTPEPEAELLFEALEPAETLEPGEPVEEEAPLFRFEPETEAQPEPASAEPDFAEPDFAETAAAEEEPAFRLEEEAPAHLFEEPVLEEFKLEEPTFAEPSFEEPVLDSLPAFEAEEFVLDSTEDAAPLEEAGELDQLEEEISPALASAGPASDFDPELVEIFLEEAGDIMESTANQLQSWMENPDDLAVVAALQRDLHTLKGGARMSDMREIGDLSHHLENLYEGLCERRFTAVPALFDLLNQCHDRLAVMLEKVQKGLAPAPAPDLIGKIDDFVHGRLGAEPEHVAPEDHAEAQATYAIAANEAEPEEDSHALQALSGEGIDTGILEIFLEEAGELTEGIDNTINAWLADRDNPAYLEEMKRLLHTLKGGARLAGMMHIGDLSHHFESFLIQSEVDRVPQDDAYFARIQAEHDKLFVQMDHLRKHGGELITAAEVTTEPQPEAETPALAAAQAEQLEPVAEQPAIPDNVIPIVAQPLPDFETPDLLPASAFHLDEPKRRSDESVKVPADLLENLVNLAGETSIIRGRIEQEMTDFSTVIGEISQTIDRARELLRRLDMETEAQVLHRYQQAATEGTEYEEFDPLEMDRYSTLNQLSRSLGETVSDMTDLRDSLVNRARDAETLLIQQGRINTELQEGLMRSRMVPFSRMVPRLRRIVRQVAQELGKKADLEIVGAEGEMDRTVLERMVPPLEHMLRNAVDHGLEMPENRIAKGKKEQGRITIHLAREGGEVVLRLTDDGKGIALDKVKQRAIERNLMKADAPLSDKEIMQFIFKPGFSTAEKVTQISGRGVGMDVVHSEIKQLGGNVKIHSAPGAGSQFTIRLPFTVSVNRALMVRVGEDLYAIP
ncbi:MAG: Hpt domain-containing protein, partial [Pseudomonadota bacterium]